MMYIESDINVLQGKNTVVKRRSAVAKWQEGPDIEKRHPQDPGHNVFGPRNLYV